MSANKVRSSAADSFGNVLGVPAVGLDEEATKPVIDH
jgi:hypothetical protein